MLASSSGRFYTFYLAGIVSLTSLLSSCKTAERNYSALDTISVNIDSSLAIKDIRSFVPLMNCNDRAGSVSYNANLKTSTESKINFTLSGKRPVVGDHSCFINLYSNQVEGLKLFSNETTVIAGNEYNVLYESDAQKITENTKFVFKKLFEKDLGNVKLLSLRYKFPVEIDPLRFAFFCFETKIIKPKPASTDILEFEIFNSDVYGNIEELKSCQLKDVFDGRTVSTDTPALVDVKIGSIRNYFVLDSADKINPPKSALAFEVYARFEGKTYYYKDLLGCTYLLDFKFSGGEHLYSEKVEKTGGCLKESSEGPYLPYRIFTKNSELGNLLNENTVLASFSRDSGDVTYSVLKFNDKTLERIGGHITKIENLKLIDSGLMYELLY